MQTDSSVRDPLMDASPERDLPPQRGGLVWWGLKLFLLGPVIVTMCVLAVFIMNERGAAQESRPSDLPVLKDAPEFSLLERSGGTVTNADLLGKVWVAQFFFAECTGPCPTLSARMSAIQGKLKKHGADVRLVSITLDPLADRPPVLKKYADRYQADADQWVFLTTLDGKSTEKLVEEGFLTTVQKGTPGSQIVHGTSFAVVDRQGRIRAFHDGMSGEVVGKVVTDVESLLREPTAP
jgi:protein SCO1/2